MYFTSLPDHSSPSFDEPAHFSRFGQQNIIFNAVSHKSYCDRHIGCLSIKTLYGGEELYGVEKRRLAVRDGQVLILNNGQEYSCRVDTAGRVRLQSVFFSKAFAAAAFRDAICSEDNLLDNAFDEPACELEFHQALDQINPVLERRLQGLMNILEENGYECDMVDEHLLFLLQHLIRIHKTEAKRIKQVGAVKQTTKAEIFKRLCIARDYVHSSFMDNPGLADISRAACLSLPQFIRHFSKVFHITPHQYLVNVKLHHAARLLQYTTAPIHEITWRCGFEDTSAFCRAFKRAYAASPLEYKAGC